MIQEGWKRPSSTCAKNDTVQRADVECKRDKKGDLGGRSINDGGNNFLYTGGGVLLGKGDVGPGFGMGNLRGKGRNNFCFSTRSKRASNGDGSTGLGGTNDREGSGKGASGLDRCKMGGEEHNIRNRTYTTQRPVGRGFRGGFVTL